MNREQAINYLISSGFTHEQVGEVVRALTYEPTTKKDCNTCTHSNEADGSNCYECVKDMCNNYDPTTKNDLGVDAVSRQAAVKAAMQDVSDRRTHGFNAGVTRAANRIKLLPPVTPQPRKGHWVYTPQRRMVDETDDGCVYETDYRCSCSECGGDFGFVRVEDSFCKYCGADMREVKE